MKQRQRWEENEKGERWSGDKRERRGEIEI